MRKVTQEEFDELLKRRELIVSLNLTGLDLNKDGFADYEFYNCNFNSVIKGRNFIRCSFVNCTFYETKFNDCVLDEVQFTTCRFPRSKFERCKMVDNKFLDCDLELSEFSEVLFTDGCCFWCSDLNFTVFNDCNMGDTGFVGCSGTHNIQGIDVFQLSVGRYPASYCAGHLSIGCKCNPLGFWLEHYKMIGEEEELEEEEIELFGTIIKYIANLYPRHAESIQIDTEESDTDLIAPILSMQSLLEEGKPLHGIANIWDDNQLDGKSVAHNGYSKSHGDWVENSYPRPNPDEQ